MEGIAASPIEESHPNRKRCPKCGNAKDVSEFSMCKRNKDGLQSWCKACHKKAKRAWIDKYPEKHLECGRRYRANNPEKCLAADRRYRAEHPEVGRAANRRWAKAHPEKCRAKESGRRARKKRAMDPKDAKAIAEFYAYVHNAPRIKCWLCGKYIPKEDRHVDHVQPLSKNGRHAMINLRPAHKKCNLSKQDKPPEKVTGQLELFAHMMVKPAA